MILLVDNYDSFTYNLAHLFGALGAEVVVRRNDEPGLEELEPDRLVISPGPGRPPPRVVEIVRRSRVPTLGVCLGHQAIGAAFGGPVVRAPEPVHGKASLIYHEGRGILTGLPSPFEAGRYHSLIVDRGALPSELIVTAETEDGLMMAVEHRSLPRFGVQFHPESILTPYGPQIVENFLGLI